MKRLCGLLCGLFLCGICFAEGWTVNAISYDVVRMPAIAVDGNNSAIVMHSRRINRLLVMQSAESGYEANEIQHTYDTYPVLKVTSNNEFALTFTDSQNMIWYGSKGSWYDWTFSAVSLSVLSAGADMALAENDIPHIAYIALAAGRYSVFHSWFDVQSFEWKREELGGFGDIRTDLPPSINVAADGRIVISCCGSSQMLTAVYSDGYWHCLPGIADVYSPPNACFTPDGLVAMAYVKNQTLYYAVYVNEIIGWVETAIVTAHLPDAPTRVSLAHSSTGVPGIAYINNMNLMYATNVAGGWTVTQIDERGYYPELVFDHNDKPLIAYKSYDYCLNKPVLKLAGISLEPFNITDLNKDKIVNFNDLVIFAGYWFAESMPPDYLPGDFDQNAKVDILDLGCFGCNWLWQGEQ